MEINVHFFILYTCGLVMFYNILSYSLLICRFTFWWHHWTANYILGAQNNALCRFHVISHFKPVAKENPYCTDMYVLCFRSLGLTSCSWQCQVQFLKQCFLVEWQKRVTPFLFWMCSLKLSRHYWSMTFLSFVFLLYKDIKRSTFILYNDTSVEPKVIKTGSMTSA